MQTPVDSDCSSLPQTAPPLKADAPLPATSERDAIRAALVLKYGITSFFVRVKVIAKVMGLSATSIHALMRQERFPLPHRRVGNVVLVHFESLVDWCCSMPGATLPEPPPSAAEQHASEKLGDVVEAAVADGVETARERGERIKLRVLATMRRKSALRRAEAGRRDIESPSSESRIERGARINAEALEKFKRQSKPPPS